MMTRTLFAVLGLLFISNPALAYTNSVNFILVGNLTKTCAATTSSSFVQFADSYSIGAPDVVLHNVGATDVYITVGTGGSSVVATIPSNSTAGGFWLKPNDAYIANKQQSDTVACITAGGTGTIAVTPTYGQ